jgi:hypothetical protein
MPKIVVFKDDGEKEMQVCYECLSNNCNDCMKDKCECTHDDTKWKFRQEFIKEQEDGKKLNMELQLLVSAWAYQLSNFLSEHNYPRPNQVLMKWEPEGTTKFKVNLEAVMDEKEEIGPSGSKTD